MGSGQDEEGSDRPLEDGPDRIEDLVLVSWHILFESDVPTGSDQLYGKNLRALFEAAAGDVLARRPPPSGWPAAGPSLDAWLRAVVDWRRPCPWGVNAVRFVRAVVKE